MLDTEKENRYPLSTIHIGMDKEFTKSSVFSATKAFLVSTFVVSICGGNEEEGLDDRSCQMCKGDAN
eukprot:scaffold1383_cov68-Cylindrotheca_fusiformis.AAC.5